MVSTKLTVLIAVAVVVTLASSAVVTPIYDANLNDNKSDDDSIELYSTPTPDLTDDKDEDEDTSDENTTIDGIPINRLSEEELNDLLDEDDNMVASDLDISVARKIVKALKDGEMYTAYDIINGGTQGGRQKRWVPIALAAARLLLKVAVRAQTPPVKGRKDTKQ